MRQNRDLYEAAWQGDNMYIKTLEIKSFGPIVHKTIELSKGLNIIEGPNESGKSTVAMFIKFMFYGLSAKAVGNTTVAEREKYINWDTGIAAGEMVVLCGDEEFKIERRLTKGEDLSGREEVIEKVRLTNLTTGESVKNVKTPGEFFFGFPEKVFMQSAFVKNIDTARIDGDGLKVALENLISSGDEEINTKKALEKLDSARKLLLHKNGLGGKIASLAKEKRELEETLEKSKDVSAETVSLEATLADIEVKASRRESEFAEYSALCRAYEAVRVGARVKEIERCEASINYLQSELGSMNPAADRTLLAKIDLCASSVKEIENDIKTLSEKRAQLEEKCSGRDLEDPGDGVEIMKEARKTKGKRAFFLASFCTFAVLSVPTLAALAMFFSVLHTLYKNVFVIALVMAVLFFFAAVGSFIMYLSCNKKWNELLDKWDTENIYTLENAVLVKREKYKYTKKLLDNIESIDETSERAVEKHDREIDHGFALAASVGIEGGGSVFDALESAKLVTEEICTSRETMTVKLESAKGRLSALLEEIGDAEREGAEQAEREALESLDRDRILEMTKEDYTRALKERDFADSSARAMRVRAAEIKNRLSVLQAVGSSPSEIAERVSFLDGEIEKLTFKHRALVTAYNALEKAGEKMRGDIMPQVTEAASRIMNRVTGGRYPSLSAEENFELSVIHSDEKRSVDYLSEGTKDAAYVSVRAALVNIMYKDTAPAMIFDECFARMDERRLGGIISVLESEEVPQSIIFSCHSLEGAAAKNANVICMDR